MVALKLSFHKYLIFGEREKKNTRTKIIHSADWLRIIVSYVNHDILFCRKMRYFENKHKKNAKNPHAYLMRNNLIQLNIIIPKRIWFSFLAWAFDEFPALTFIAHLRSINVLIYNLQCARLL